MIKTYKDKETQKIYDGERSLRLPHNIQAIARRKLRMLNFAISLTDLLVPPGNRLEKLHGDRKDQHSIRINDQWRICFHWNNDAYDVEITDYH